MKSFDRLARLLVRWLFVLGLSIVPGLVRSGPVAAAEAAASSVGATLTVLAEPVEVAVAGSAFDTGLDGQSLRAGDVVRTGSGGLAVVTFFDGSESQLGANSQVQIDQAEATPAPQIAFTQSMGVTVNHVVPLPPGGSFRTNTPSVTGLVRGTSYVVSVAPDAEAADADPALVDAATPTAQTGMTSVVLLTDRDGHVGRVDVAKHDSDEPAVRLASAGDAAAGSLAAKTTTRARLDPPSLARLESVANTRNDVTAAREAEHHAHVMERALAPILAAHHAAGEGVDNSEPERAPVVVLPPVPVKPSPAGAPATDAQPRKTDEPAVGERGAHVNPPVVAGGEQTDRPSPPTPPKPTAATGSHATDPTEARHEDAKSSDSRPKADNPPPATAQHPSGSDARSSDPAPASAPKAPSDDHRTPSPPPAPAAPSPPPAPVPVQPVVVVNPEPVKPPPAVTADAAVAKAKP
jgi:hypothetical protein